MGPISSYNVIYEILAKTIANRIKPFLDGLVDYEQSAFTPGRNIHDNIMITKFRCRNPLTLLKLDICKAYDKVSWMATRETLSRMNFPQKFSGWVHACISSPIFLCNANGLHSEGFKDKRGIRQGDPLPLYLFILTQQNLGNFPL